MGFQPFKPQLKKPALGRASRHIVEKIDSKTLRTNIRRQRSAQSASDLLPELPQPGESIHCLMQGYFDLMQVIAVTAKRITDLKTLRIATLCYSKRNLQEMCELLEQMPGLHFTLLVSDFFVGNNKEGHAGAVAQLTAFPNVRVSCNRTHCKVTLFESPTHAITFEGSANLRTNRNWEQLQITHDRELHDWHADWLDRMVTHGKQ